MADGNPAYARAPVEPERLRRTGISAIGDIPWGTHLCQFYQDKQDLIDILVPYFKAGLENNEFCMWVTSEPLHSTEARAALAANVKNLETYIANEQLEILDAGWYTSGGFDSERVLQSWVDRFERARLRGFDGLRLTGNPSWLERQDWHGFMEYEAAVDGIFGQLRMLGICTYALSKCDALQIMDVISNHKFGLVKRGGKWEVITHGDAKQLRSNQTQLLDSQRLANVGSWERDVATGRVRWSDQMYRIYGLPDDTQPVFRMFLGQVHPEDLGIISEAQKRVLAANAPIVLEYRITRPDGEVRFIRSIAEGIKNEQGAPVRFVGADQDITEQVKATELLRESEERLRASEARLMSAQRLANLGSWDRDDVTGNTEFSDEMLRILGMPANPPRTLAEFLNYVHSEDRKYVSDGALRARLTGKSEAGEYRIVRADGEIRFVRSVLQAIRDEHGTVIRVVGATQDITDLKRAQQESAARQKLESLGTLASGIAHDFNNLLGGVLAESELALAELDSGLHPREQLGAIRDVALRGSEIVRQLMVYAGVESAPVGPVDLSRIIREMIDLLKVSVSKHAELETDLPNDLPCVQADAAQIRQIIMNLVTNASEAIGKRDGVIRIAARRMSPDQSSSGEIPSYLSGIDHVQLEVSDTGCGMLPRVQTRVFDPFFTTKSAGRGLGLAIVDRIVHSLRGKIHMASELGKGTTFQISLPSREIDPIPEPLFPVEGAADFSASATVLVVEDEDILRQAVAKALRRSGLEVLETANGSAAIEILRASGNKIDVILLDMTIPGSSSDEVAAEYARVRSDAKIIVTSAYSEETARKTMSVPQVRGFIRKPFHLGVLVETLRNTLSS